MDNPAGLAGQTIGKYRIVEHLGRGGMAEVYKAYQPSLDRYVALKLMHAFLAADQDFIARFEREAKNVAVLRHPNIVQVYDFDVQNGTPYMVMEYIEGGTLKSHLEDLARQGQHLATPEAIHVVEEVGKALAYAHSHQMIHRDVKPANVLLETGGRVILTDFGIAKILTGPSYTVTGATIGTPAYMSPEQGLGRPGDHRSDIYALGVMLYQLATGQLPYEADTPLAVMLKHVNEPLPLPRTFQPDMPEGLERIILKAMAKNPDDRFQSADEMLAQLGNLDNAQLLAIPPASMAAGADAHAATVAMPLGGTRAGGAGSPPPPADVTRIANAASGPTPAGATIVSRTGVGLGAVTGTVAGAATPAAAPARKSSLPLGLIAALIVIILLLVVAVGAFAATGGFGLLAKPAATNTQVSATSTTTAAPSATPTLLAPSATVPAGSPTPNQVASQLAALEETQAAIQAAVASATPTGTPNQTATAAACTFDFQVSTQQPADGQTLNVGSNITKTLTLSNTGLCAYKPGTILSETTKLAGSPAITVSVPAIAPQATGDVAFSWPGRKSAGSTVRGFVMRDPSGTAIGQPLTLTLKYVQAATAVPLATDTPVPPAATDTPAVSTAGLTDVGPAAVIACKYQGQNNMDYNCTIKLTYAGGTGRMTLSVDGQPGQSFQAGESAFYNIISRRCTPRPYNLNLVDDGTNSQVSKNYYFDPKSNGAKFPGGNCTLGP
jgi:predicted Ser/Thr protein kinase